MVDHSYVIIICSVSSTSSLSPTADSPVLLSLIYFCVLTYFLPAVCPLPRRLLLQPRSLGFSHRGDPNSSPGEVMRDLWWTKWHWGRFYPSTSPANHSTDCCTVIINHHLGLSPRTQATELGSVFFYYSKALAVTRLLSVNWMKTG
jgi:hypothetical protein